MTLLAAITNPAAGSLPGSSEKAHRIVLTPGAAPPPPPPPPTSSALPTPIPPSAWSLSPADPTLATAASYLAASLDSCSSLPRLRLLLTNFIATLSQSLALPTPPAAVPAAIRAVAPYFPATIASLVASKAASLAEHDIFLALAESGLLTHPPPELISSLCDNGRVDLVCALLRQAADNRSSEILAALRCFHPIVLTPGAAPPPPTSSALPTPIPPSAWSLSPADPTLATAASYLAASLDSCSSLPRLRLLLTNFIATLSQSLALPAPPAAVPAAIRAVAPYFPAAIASLVASKAASLAQHDILLALAESRLLTDPPPELISSLCDNNRVDLVCALLRQAADIRSSEILAALRCFLSPASEKAYDAMMDVKGRWKDAAVLAVNRCPERSAGKKRNVDAAARRAALLLMMGHDGFTSPEVCLHYLFASGNVDSVVLGAAMAELDGGEVVRLMRYLNKWIGKYRRFSEAHTCPEVVENLGFEQCDSVPSFGAVARALGVLLDNHFSHLVLNADVREDLRAAELMVRELAAEAESSGPILDLLHRLQLDK